MRDVPPPKQESFFALLGPGLITGASDDDPSGIATYSQVGAQFGYGLLWTLLFSYPLMSVIQEISARVGRVTGHGIARNLRARYSRWLLWSIVFSLFAANTLNIGADIGAMGAALQLLAGGPALLYAIVFGLLSIFLEVFIPYKRYVFILKWLTLALFAYVAVALIVHVDWSTALKATLIPHVTLTKSYLTSLLAILGTTLSPYLLFWQASQEAEEIHDHVEQHSLKQKPTEAAREIRRVRWDTYVGMGFSNLVAFFIVLSAAATLHARGIADISSAAQAAQALEPISGRYAFWLFASGIIGTGLLAVPVLAGSVAYAAGESFGWRVGLERKPRQAKAFYAVLAIATLIGVLLNFLHINPMKALFWSAVINGIACVPVMAAIMRLAADPKIMGPFTIPLPLKIFGWLTTFVMAAACLGFFMTARS